MFPRPLEPAPKPPWSHLLPLSSWLTLLQPHGRLAIPEYSRHSLASGPLWSLLPLPGQPLQDGCVAHYLTSFNSLFKCLSHTKLSWPPFQKLHPTTPTFLALLSFIALIYFQHIVYFTNFFCFFLWMYTGIDVGCAHWWVSVYKPVPCTVVLNQCVLNK